MPGPWVYDPNATGSARESAMSGGSGVAGWVSNLGGMSSTTGLLEVNVDAGGNKTRSIDGRAAVTSLLGAGAAAASGAATFSAAAGPGGAVAGAVLGTVIGAVNGAFAAYDGQKAIAALNKILTDLEPKLNTNPPDSKAEELAACISYCLGKNAVKRNKGLANASIAGQPVVALYKAGKAIYKFGIGTKGVNRRENAQKLMKLAEESGDIGEYARKVVKVIIMKDFERIAVDALADAMKSG